MSKAFNTITLGFCIAAFPALANAQSLASNNTRTQARYNKEKLFADSQRKLFSVTSWAGANMSELLAAWGNFTRRSALPNGITVYIFETRYSGSGGTYTPGYIVTDPSGNVLAQKAAKDNTYAYDFTDFYEFYTDKNQRILYVKTGTR